MSFSHLDDGTEETTWLSAVAQRDLPELVLGMDALVVVAPHPDDESLGVGGLLHHASARGVPITLIVVTDGEKSHPASTTVSTTELGRLRRRELRTAVEAIAPGAAVRFLGIPDGAVDDFREVLAHAVGDETARLRRSSERPLVVGPWQGDRHRDHRLAGEVTADAARSAGIDYLAYPIWLWHWGGPEDVPWDAVRVLPLDAYDIDAKRRAIAAHISQSAPLSGDPGDEVMLHARMISHFDRPFEILIEERTPAAVPTDTGSISTEWFERFYARNDDPWGFDTRWYEQRKRDILLASLPERRYARGLELGCATGALTARLAERCDRLTAVDASSAAVDRARARLAPCENVEVSRNVLPAEWPDGSFDLIVFSEIGYYWDAVDLEKALSRMRASLTEHGTLVACHWRHPVPAHRTTGDGVHIALRTLSGFDNLVHHEEPDFILDVLSPHPARSVADREGLVS